MPVCRSLLIGTIEQGCHACRVTVQTLAAPADFVLFWLSNKTFKWDHRNAAYACIFFLKPKLHKGLLCSSSDFVHVFREPAMPASEHI